MALCEAELGSCITAHRSVGHFSAQLGDCIVFVPWNGLCKFNCNANCSSCYRCTGLWHSGELCWSSRWEMNFSLFSLSFSLGLTSLKVLCRKFLWSFTINTLLRVFELNSAEKFPHKLSHSTFSLSFLLDMLGMIAFGGKYEVMQLISACWSKKLTPSDFNYSFHPTAVFYKNIGWGSFDGYERLEAALRWDAFLWFLKCYTFKVKHRNYKKELQCNSKTFFSYNAHIGEVLKKLCSSPQ